MTLGIRMEVDLRPGHTTLNGDPASLPKKGAESPFSAISIVAKRLDGSRWHLVWR